MVNPIQDYILRILDYYLLQLAACGRDSERNDTLGSMRSVWNGKMTPKFAKLTETFKFQNRPTETEIKIIEKRNSNRAKQENQQEIIKLDSEIDI